MWFKISDEMYPPSRVIRWPRPVLHKALKHYNAGEWVLLFGIYEFFNWSVHECRVIILLLLLCLLLLLLLSNFVTATTIKLHMKNNNKNKEINLHTFSVQWSLMQAVFLYLLLLYLLLLLLCNFVVARSSWHVEECNWEGSGQLDVPPVEAYGGQDQYYVRSSWHLGECNWEGSGQSDVPPNRGIWWPKWYELPM